MFELRKPSIEARLRCRAHGEVHGEPNLSEPTIVWKGDVVCMFCQRAHLCEPNEAGALVYPHVREDGFCACGTALFPNGDRKDFAAQPKCPECARIIWARQQPQTTSASP